ncbi:MAG: carboxypeptidase-like regulatory domain-containing protein [Mucilaginibacter sp.]|nr:carboxypeptidase-like regulatory domain-containing protein [Mucilaginibacter sp.]
MVRLNYPHILLFLLCFLPTLCVAQNVYDGQVIDKLTELAVPGVTVTLQKAKVVTSTNQQGYFKLSVENALPNDTLVFTSVGYNPYKLAIANYERQMFVQLQASNTLLNQVTITNSKIKSVTLGKFGLSDIRQVNANKYYTMPFIHQSWYAKFFQAPQENTVLTMVKLGRRDFYDIGIDSGSLTTATKYARFLVHVSTINPDNGEPGKAIFTKEISLTDNSQLITIDFSKDKVVIPGTKFFIAIEWLIIPLNEVITLGYAEKVEKVRKDGTQLKLGTAEYTAHYQPCLVLYTRYHSERHWLRLGNMGWNIMGMPELSEIIPAKIWVKDSGTWSEKLSSHEIALSATLHY